MAIYVTHDDGHVLESETMNKTVNDMESFSDKFNIRELQNNEPHEIVWGFANQVNLDQKQTIKDISHPLVGNDHD